MPRPIIRPPVWATPLAEGNDVTDFLGFIGTLHVEPWMEQGSCVSTNNPDAWFPGVGPRTWNTHAVIRVCRRCPVADACLRYAIERPDLQGIWGGTTHRERKSARKESA